MVPLAAEQKSKSDPKPQPKKIKKFDRVTAVNAAERQFADKYAKFRKNLEDEEKNMTDVVAAHASGPYAQEFKSEVQSVVFRHGWLEAILSDNPAKLQNKKAEVSPNQQAGQDVAHQDQVAAAGASSRNSALLCSGAPCEHWEKLEIVGDLLQVRAAFVSAEDQDALKRVFEEFEKRKEIPQTLLSACQRAVRDLRGALSAAEKRALKEEEKKEKQLQKRDKQLSKKVPLRHSVLSHTSRHVMIMMHVKLMVAWCHDGEASCSSIATAIDTFKSLSDVLRVSLCIVCVIRLVPSPFPRQILAVDEVLAAKKAPAAAQGILHSELGGKHQVQSCANSDVSLRSTAWLAKASESWASSCYGQGGVLEAHVNEFAAKFMKSHLRLTDGRAQCKLRDEHALAWTSLRTLFEDIGLSGTGWSATFNSDMLESDSGLGKAVMPTLVAQAASKLLPARLESGALARVRVGIRGTRRVLIINGVQYCKEVLRVSSMVEKIAQLQDEVNSLSMDSVEKLLGKHTSMFQWVRAYA